MPHFKSGDVSPQSKLARRLLYKDSSGQFVAEMPKTFFITTTIDYTN
jgi:hypothetical protein